MISPALTALVTVIPPPRTSICDVVGFTMGEGQDHRPPGGPQAFPGGPQGPAPRGGGVPPVAQPPASLPHQPALPLPLCGENLWR